jgi:uncharacterized membrane protein
MYSLVKVLILYLILKIIVIIFSVITTAIIIMFVVFIVTYTLTSSEHLHKKIRFTHPKEEDNIHELYAKGKISQREYLRKKNDKYTA